MGKLSKRKKLMNAGVIARPVSAEEALLKGYAPDVRLPVLEKREIEAARARHEKSLEEKRARREELRTAQNRPWKTALPAIVDLRKAAPMDMGQITAQFNSDIREIRAEEAAKTKPKKAG